MKQTAPTPRAASPLFSLLAHYVSGGIDQPVWDRFMGILDADSVSTTERLAYARFMHDALIDQRGSFPELPVDDEMKGLLSELSASKAA